MAFGGDMALAQNRKMSPDQREQLRQALRELPSLPNPVDCIDVGERLSYIDMVVYMARDVGQMGQDGEAIRSSHVRANLQIDWNKVLSLGNRWYDRTVKAFDHDTYVQCAAALKTIQEDLDTHLKKLQQPAHRINSFLNGTAMSVSLGGDMIAMMLPSPDVLLQMATCYECYRQLVDIAFALQQYQAEHESYPDTLSELVPKYLAELPQDLFTAEDLKYRRDDGGYLLHSVGANQQDDKGLSTWKDDVTDGDDIAVRVPRVEPAAP